MIHMPHKTVLCKYCQSGWGFVMVLDIEGTSYVCKKCKKKNYRLDHGKDTAD
jgi:hypothetical protein